MIAAVQSIKGDSVVQFTVVQGMCEQIEVTNGSRFEPKR